jgi:hypothetical protein
MSTPLTPFEQVVAFLELISDTGSSFRKSAEEWISEFHKNMVAFTEELQKEIAEHEKLEAEAFEVLKNGGWLGMERHLTGPQVRSVHLIAQRNGESAAHDALRHYFGKNNWALIAEIIEQWLDVPYLKRREQVIRDSLAAHRAGQYTLSIPALLPLAEGLSAEIVGSAAGKQNVVKAVARQWKAREQEIWTELYSDVVVHVIYKHYDFAKDPAPYLNRNGILHGRVADYGTDINSLRVFLLVDCVAELWRGQRTRP